MLLYSFAVALIVTAQEINGEPHTRPSSATPLNSTLPPTEESSSHNTTDAEVGSRISTILRDLPTIKNVSIFICVLTTLLITCLVIKICRSARKIRKTRKYDIITTPAERVEMAPLNEENDEEDDSTLFDVKYRMKMSCSFPTLRQKPLAKKPLALRVQQCRKSNISERTTIQPYMFNPESDPEEQEGPVEEIVVQMSLNVSVW